MIIFEKVNFQDDITCLDKIVIWVGLKPPNHGPRIKVSNKINKMDVNDCFVITLPDKKIIGNPKLSNKKINKIKKFIDNNLDLLIDLNNNKISIINSLKYFKKFGDFDFNDNLEDL